MILFLEGKMGHVFHPLPPWRRVIVFDSGQPASKPLLFILPRKGSPGKDRGWCARQQQKTRRRTGWSELY
jgi:hypothetical protein